MMTRRLFLSVTASVAAAGLLGAAAEMGAGVVPFDSEGGPLEVGQSYLLFLNRQEEGPHSNQGRFQVAGDHLVAVTPEGQASRELNMQPVQAAVATVQRSLHSGR